MKKLALIFFLFLNVFYSKAQDPVMNLCLVTVDSNSTHNIVVWEKASQVSAFPIDSVKIYRTTLLLNDTLVGAVHWDSLSTFHDYSVDPNLRSYKYRISGVNNQGVEGLKSLPHQTIHFSILAQGDSILLGWSKYIGQPINFYNCLSDSAGSLPGWQWVNSTANNIDTAWWDKNTPADWTGLSYLVNVNWTTQCSATKAQDHNSTRSNRTNSIVNNPNGLVRYENTIHDILVYPNPVSAICKLEFSSSMWTPIEILVVDILGRPMTKHNTIKVFGQYKADLDLSELEGGVYEIIINSNGEKYSRKIIKE